MISVEQQKEEIKMTKDQIAESFLEGLQEQGLSIRGAAARAGYNHPQVLRITNSQNYTINTLLRALSAANMQAVIVPRVVHEEE